LLGDLRLWIVSFTPISFSGLMKRTLHQLLSISLLSLLTFSCAKESATPADQIRDDNLAMGNPSGAVTDVNSPSNYLIVKDQYALSYHRDRGTPNWVSWHLNKGWLGDAPRQDNFTSDNTLPAGWFRADAASYSGSGFDRGHNCPSADRTSSVTDNSATFLMTNMIPQARTTTSALGPAWRTTAAP
jgi:endonuclease G